jgi:SAM-dependent methyltransferase
MGLYRDVVFPRFVSWAMGTPALHPLRARALAGARGRVLEIGFGPGHNLPFYASGVERVVAVDPSAGLSELARGRIAQSAVEVEHHQITAERLPFESGSFDSAVSTFTLCSVPDVEAALAEVARVLRPGGELFFLEHGLCPDPAVGRWQRRITPLWRRVCDGCRLDRDVPALVAGAGLEPEITELCLPGSPRWLGHAYLGRGRRPAPAS